VLLVLQRSIYIRNKNKNKNSYLHISRRYLIMDAYLTLLRNSQLRRLTPTPTPTPVVWARQPTASHRIGIAAPGDINTSSSVKW
jgi:hypothetical protein